MAKPSNRLSPRDEMASMAILCLSSSFAGAVAMFMGWVVTAFYAAMMMMFFVLALKAPRED